MMVDSDSPDAYREIIVRIVPAHRGLFDFDDDDVVCAVRPRHTLKETARSYDAFIFTNLKIEGLQTPSRPSPNQPEQLKGLPLAGVEQIVMRWNRFTHYLADFVSGEKAPHMMRERLFESLSSGLEVLLSDRPLSDGPVRIWWDCKATELLDLPWDLMACRHKTMDGGFSFVRGLPPDEYPPEVPISTDGPRLALIFDPQRPPDSLLQTLKQIPQMKVIPLTGNPREALQQVVKEGYEIVHIVGDGIVSLACDGILYLAQDQAAPELAPTELSSLLHGSRVMLLSLTTHAGDNPDTIPMADRFVPSAYRAFIYLGSADLPLPSIVAPLGPIFDWLREMFWNQFYSTLATTCDLEAAMREAQSLSHGPIPMALFLRYRSGRVFIHREKRRSLFKSAQEAVIEENPKQAFDELVVSQNLVDRLSLLKGEYGSDSLPESVNTFLKSEVEHQKRVTTTLDQISKGEAQEL
jgi:hypothetical protein